MSKNESSKENYFNVSVDLKSTEQFQNMLSLLKTIYNTTDDEKMKELIISQIDDIATHTCYKEKLAYYDKEIDRLNKFIADNCEVDIKENLLGVIGGYVDNIIAIISKNQREVYELCRLLDNVPEKDLERQLIVNEYKLKSLYRVFYEGEEK